MSKLLENMNPEQRSAAETIHGPLLVLAGAGTGKTMVITFRIAYMIEQGIKARNILGMTFTNKAAKEMQERVGKLVSPKVAKKVTLGTFHSFASQILRKEIKALGDYNSNFTIAIENDQKSLIRQAIAEQGYMNEKISADVACSVISNAKNNMMDPAKLLNIASNEFELKVAKIYQRYQKLLENQNMLDFDDMLLFVVKIWEENPKILKKYRNHYTHLLVDEYQDTNLVQFKMLELLTGEHKNICVVGDDDQSIYSWRGAQVEHILEFPSYFPGAKVVKLEQNYRSTNKILNAANEVIQGNDDRFNKNLWSSLGDGDDLTIVNVPTGDEESEFVAEAIENKVASDSKLTYNDIAILYRSNYLSRSMEESLRKNSIPYRIVGSNSFYQRKEILDALAYLRLAVNPRDDQSLLRILSVPPRGLGDKAIKTLKSYQESTHLPLTELLGDETFLEDLSAKASKGAKKLADTISRYQDIFKQTGDMTGKVKSYLEDVEYLDGFLKIYKRYEEALKRQENVFEFLNSIASFEDKSPHQPTLLDFVESFSLMDDNDSDDDEENPNAVTLMTVHASKGLEFPHVFLVGVEQKLFPHERSLMEGGCDEERRLFYVAVTRAKFNLIMTHANQRYRHGRLYTQRSSQFLSDISEKYAQRMKHKDFFNDVSEEQFDEAFSKIYEMFDNMDDEQKS